jgi:hypothetical protein
MNLRAGKRRAIAAMLTGVVASGCAAHARSTEPSALDPLKSGEWGGQHIAMTVATSGTQIEFDCGKASIDGAIDVDRAGAFTATGTFFQERPGPTTPDGPPRRPMRVSGTVKGDAMQVTIVLTDRDEDVGTFTLSFGSSARLVKCR